LIPILIILFVVALGSMRAVALHQAHGEVAANAEVRLSLIAKAVTTDLSQSAAGLSLAEPSSALQGLLENALPPLATNAGRHIVLTDPQGLALAAAPAGGNLVGRYLDEILGSSQPLTTLGERAGVLRLSL